MTDKTRSHYGKKRTKVLKRCRELKAQGYVAIYCNHYYRRRYLEQRYI